MQKMAQFLTIGWHEGRVRLGKDYQSWEKFVAWRFCWSWLM